MGKRQDKGEQVVYRHEKAGHTDVWHKNSAGNTTKEGHRRISRRSGTVTDHWGRTVRKGR